MRDQLHAGPLGKGFEPVRNRSNSIILKPEGGLWTSTYTPLGEFDSAWMRFYYGRDKLRTGQVFRVSPKARLVTIHSLEDLRLVHEAYGIARPPKPPEEMANVWGVFHPARLDFEELAKDYDGMHLTEAGERETRDRFADYTLAGWDCESTLWFNLECLKFDRKVPLGRNSPRRAAMRLAAARRD